MKKTVSSIIVFLFSLSVSAKKSDLPLSFIENKGQIKNQFQVAREDVDFKVSSAGLNVFIGDGKLHYQFNRKTKGKSGDNNNLDIYRMDVELLGCNTAALIEREEQQDYFERYYNMRSQPTAHSYNKITYKNIYPAIDWVLYINDGHVEYDFVIHDGGNSSDIKIQYNGATSLSIAKTGDLVINTPMGTIRESAPFSFQNDGKTISSSFVLNNKTVSFNVDKYANALTIDPKIVWSSYYGGESNDYGTSIANDDSGYVYLAGGTSSINNIATIGSHQVVLNGGNDAVIAKFTSAGDIVWATYYGGGGAEIETAIVCDRFFNVFICGTTSSATGIATFGGHQQVKSNGDDAYLVKFNSQGIRKWATYYGGDSTEHGQALACDDSGNVYLAGETNSLINISTPNSHKQTLQAGSMFGDAFLVKFDSTGQRIWGTYFGGEENDWAYGLCIDHSNNIYITGETNSSADIASLGSYQEILTGGKDAFISKFNSGGQLTWSTYYGGSSFETGLSLTVHNSDLYAVGNTNSPDGIATINGYQQTLQGGNNIYIARFDTTGNRIWGSYYGEESLAFQSSTGNKVAIDNSGQSIYLVATAYNHQSSMATNGAPQKNYGGGAMDVLLSKFDVSGSRLWATYFGTCLYDIEGGCTVDIDNNIYISGYTNNDYMASPNSYQEAKDNQYDAFISKFNNNTISLTGDTVLCSGSTAIYYAYWVPGAESYTWTLPSGWIGSSNVDTIVVTAGANSGTISVIANKSCSTEPTQQLFILVHPTPTPIISQSGSILSVPNIYVTYQWYNANGAISNATSNSTTILSPGDYYVVVTDTNGCTGQSAPFPVSVTTMEAEIGFSLYPNPNKGSFQIKAAGLADCKSVEMEILDAVGKRIILKKLSVVNGKLNEIIELENNVAPGIYLLKLKSDKYCMAKTFSKNR